MLETFKKDIQAVKDRDPAARSTLETVLVSSGLHAIMLHRPDVYKRQIMQGRRVQSGVLFCRKEEQTFEFACFLSAGHV